jgi:hypothetical protein
LAQRLGQLGVFALLATALSAALASADSIGFAGASTGSIDLRRSATACPSRKPLF